jgi:hypothetical protein
MSRIEDMGIGELLSIIRRLPAGERRERALAAALSSLIEVEIEWRLDLRHQNVGFHNVSTIGNMGEGRGEMAGAVDHVGEAAERYRYECRWRSMAKALLAHLNERQRMAVLLTGYAVDDHNRRGRSVAVSGIERHAQILAGDRHMTLAEACDAQLVILKRLGWTSMAGYGVGEWPRISLQSWCLAPVYFDAPSQRKLMHRLRKTGKEVPFRTVETLRNTAKRGRANLVIVVMHQALCKLLQL